MVTLYEYLHNICNYKYISSLGSFDQDLVRFYKYHHTLDLGIILNNFNALYDELWTTLKQSKSDTLDNTVKEETKIKLITPNVNKYSNVVKIDFKRAFTNYSIQHLSKKELKLYNYFCNKVSRLYILPESKKYLYNYILTNIIMAMSGRVKLNELRYDVYSDVMYMASRYGDILKSEVDGCYVYTNEYNYNYMEVLGEYSIFKYDYIYFLDKGIQINHYNKNKTEIKGLNKLDPNIYSMVIWKFLINFDDSVIDNFFYNEIKTPIIDWCKKSKDGLTGTLCLKNMILNVDTHDEHSVEQLNQYKDYISKNAYFSKISKILEQILLYRS